MAYAGLTTHLTGLRGSGVEHEDQSKLCCVKWRKPVVETHRHPRPPKKHWRTAMTISSTQRIRLCSSCTRLRHNIERKNKKTPKNPRFSGEFDGNRTLTSGFVFGF